MAAYAATAGAVVPITADSLSPQGSAQMVSDSSSSLGSTIKFNAGSLAGGLTPVSGSVLGMYDSQFSPASIEAAATWLGSNSIKYAQDFFDATSMSTISDPWNVGDPSYWGTGSTDPFTMVWGVPMMACGSNKNTSGYAQVANGTDNSYYKTLAQTLVSDGFGSSYIRLGWEFNADWMGWVICDQNGNLG